jgi:uncharacterized protein YcaQ
MVWDVAVRETISAAQARRIALSAQGFGRPRPAAVGTRQLNALIGRLGLLQIDSVNVFERSHYLPAFARLGRYEKADLDRSTLTAGAPHLEYWAHEAAFVRREDWPLFRWRMDFFRERFSRDPDGWVAQNQSMLDWLRAELADKGPLVAGDIEHDANRRTGPWWGWSDVKRGLEFLFYFGEVTTAGRQRFQRRYALTADTLDTRILDRRIPAPEARRELVRRAAKALGVATAADLADYYRIGTTAALPAIRDLEDSGELIPVAVRGWEKGGRPAKAWLHSSARVPRRIDATALLSPFDPMVWFRERTLRMFDFHYRIEIYTPQPKRVFGYYVLPILLDDRIVGRLDLKSDRKAGVLRVQAAWAEEGAPRETAERTAALLRETASWQGLDEILVQPRGTLAERLGAALAVERLTA